MKKKTARTAGLLGIFLGIFGANDWYLDRKVKGIIHVCMASIGMILGIVIWVVLPNVLSLSVLFSARNTLTAFNWVAASLMIVSAVWGAIEGIIVLIMGDKVLEGKKNG